MDWFKNKTIIVPFDFSEESINAVKVAKQLVGDGREIHVVHVVPDLDAASFPGLVGSPIDDDLRKRDAHEKLIDALCDIATDAVSLEVRIGNPGKEVAQFAKEISNGLIVISSHGRSGLSRVLLGSVAERVVRLASCPVMVLRASKSQTTRLGKKGGSQVADPIRHSDDLQEVYSTNDSFDAEIVRNSLNAAGMKCVIDGEGQAGFTGLSSIPIRLLVRAEDFDRALEHIQTHESQ